MRARRSGQFDDLPAEAEGQVARNEHGPQNFGKPLIMHIIKTTVAASDEVTRHVKRDDHGSASSVDAKVGKPFDTAVVEDTVRTMLQASPGMNGRTRRTTNKA